MNVKKELVKNIGSLVDNHSELCLSEITTLATDIYHGYLSLTRASNITGAIKSLEQQVDTFYYNASDVELVLQDILNTLHVKKSTTIVKFNYVDWRGIIENKSSRDYEKHKDFKLTIPDYTYFENLGTAHKINKIIKAVGVEGYGIMFGLLLASGK